MAQLDVIQNEEPESSSGVVRHCRSCWRKDIHFPVPYPPFIFGFLLIMSLGLILFIRPSRCVCCGTTRVF